MFIKTASTVIQATAWIVQGYLKAKNALTEWTDANTLAWLEKKKQATDSIPKPSTINGDNTGKNTFDSSGAIQKQIDILKGKQVEEAKVYEERMKAIDKFTNFVAESEKTIVKAAEKGSKVVVPDPFKDINQKTIDNGEDPTITKQKKDKADYEEWALAHRTAKFEQEKMWMGEDIALEDQKKVDDLVKAAQFEAAMTEVHRQELEIRKNNMFALKQWEKMSMKEKLETTKTTLNDLAALQKSKNKELFYIGQTASAANAAIATAEGAIRAYTSFAGLGPVGIALGVAAAAAITAYGLEQQKTIWTQKPAGFSTGGVVGMGSLTGDNNLIAVNRKERVLTDEQNQSFEMLALNHSYGNTETNNILLAMYNKLNQPAIIVLDSVKVNDTLNRETNRRLE
jgi:hypothetical protein